MKNILCQLSIFCFSHFSFSQVDSVQRIVGQDTTYQYIEKIKSKDNLPEVVLVSYTSLFGNNPIKEITRYDNDYVIEHKFNELPHYFSTIENTSKYKSTYRYFKLEEIPENLLDSIKKHTMDSVVIDRYRPKYYRNSEGKEYFEFWWEVESHEVPGGIESFRSSIAIDKNGNLISE